MAKCVGLIIAGVVLVALVIGLIGCRPTASGSIPDNWNVYAEIYKDPSAGISVSWDEDDNLSVRVGISYRVRRTPCVVLEDGRAAGDRWQSFAAHHAS